MNDILKEINSRITEEEEWISDLEVRMVEINAAKQIRKKKRRKRNEDSLTDLWDNIKHTDICIIGVTEGEEGDNGSEKMFEEIITENQFRKWIEDLKRQFSKDDTTGKRESQSCILSICLFNLYAEYIIRNARLDEAEAEINNLRYADDTTLMAESKEELKNLLMKVKGKRESPYHFMANRQENNGNSGRLNFPGFQNHCRR